MNELLKVALSAAKEAAEIAVKVRNSGNIGLNFKGDVNLCTIADIEAEKAIIAQISAAYPEHTILSEESNSELENRDYSGPLWIIDPIDGTTNFAHGHNHVGISIAFADEGIVKAGVVAVPFQHEIFTALKGEGAYLNGKRIECGTADNIKSALVCTGFPYERNELDPLIKRFTRILKDCRDMRRLGACSVDMCWVACGRLDLYYEDVMPWDMAAAGLICKEAGAKIEYFRQPSLKNLPADLNSEGLIVGNSKLISIAKGLFAA